MSNFRGLKKGELDMNESITVEEAVTKENIKKNYAYLFVKRLFDIVCGLLGIVILLPISIIVKISYMISGDFKSIFYNQKRIGKNGKVFKLYKFRTMVTNADEVLKELLKDPKYKKEWELNQKFSNDPRITKMGKILRKASLDELPQFINVLIGDMSLIGPRPLVLGELDAHEGNHSLYESIRPGITSWWACHGRSNTTYEERLNLEYYYIRNQSLKLDIKCVFDTIKAVIFKTGAK